MKKDETKFNQTFENQKLNIMKFSIIITIFAFYPAISTSVYSMTIPLSERSLEGNDNLPQTSVVAISRVCVVNCGNDPNHNQIKRHADEGICIVDCDDEEPRNIVKHV
eukprot:Awhi_evm1s14451